MSRKEVSRAGLVKAARAGKITIAQGALALHLSVRQFQRVKVRFVAEGAGGLLHRLRGRPSPRRLAPEIRAPRPRCSRPRPRGASNASGKPCKTGSSAGCACAASAPWRRPTPSCPPSSPPSTHASRGGPPTRCPPGAAPRDLAAGLSCRYTRTVAHDNTVRLGPRWVQFPRRRSYAGRRLELRECLDGRLLVFADGYCLATQPAPPADFVLRPRRGPSADRRPRLRAPQSRVPEGGRYPPPPRKGPVSPRTCSAAAARKPAPTHPWRHTFPLLNPEPGDDIFTEQLT